ncbi:40S ribosomal protein S27-like [Phytophthora nicotianae]|nr:40S ribosomal protein S27-like [Phytophthora nicotianae]
MPRDLLHPSAAEEASKHKLRRLVQAPNSYFMDVKCPGCFNITTVFSHAQTVVLCGSCSVMLCQPTGGKARLTDGCQYRKKTEDGEGTKQESKLNTPAQIFFSSHAHSLSTRSGSRCVCEERKPAGRLDRVGTLRLVPEVAANVNRGT